MKLKFRYLFFALYVKVEFISAIHSKTFKQDIKKRKRKDKNKKRT